MGSKQKQVQLRQKEMLERKLKDRVSSLSGKGIGPADINKDAFAKKLQAKIRAIDERLKAIAGIEKKTEELANKKAEKAAAPSPKAPEVSKEKEPKKAPAEGKEKKEKKKKKETE